MVSCRIKFNHFEGDQSTYRLRCKRCNKIIVPETDICTLLNGGPAAMLIHMDLDGTTECDSENLPLMHSSVEAKEVSYASLNGYRPDVCRQNVETQTPSQKKTQQHRR